MNRNEGSRLNNSNAVVILDELIALGIVIILITAVLVSFIELQRYSSNVSDQKELYEKAIEISGELQNHEDLIYRGRQAVFDNDKINEFDRQKMLEIIIVPEETELRIILKDISSDEIKLNLTSCRKDVKVIYSNYLESAVYSSPVNLRINDFETHAAVLSVFLWR
jgi:hypothetical protein